VKKILLGLVVLLLLYVGFNAYLAKLWTLTGFSVEKETVTLNFSSAYNQGCGGAASCASEKREAIKRILWLYPPAWGKQVELYIDGHPESGPDGYDA
jgi:hypothetical protein